MITLKPLLHPLQKPYFWQTNCSHLLERPLPTDRLDKELRLHQVMPTQQNDNGGCTGWLWMAFTS
jgi:hypothetical protein